jgi:hypothetical protein
VGRKIPDRELEEPLSYSGQGERKVLEERSCSEECGLRQSGIRADILSVYFRQGVKKRKAL